MKLPTESLGRIAADLGRAAVGNRLRNRRLQRVGVKVARKPSASLPTSLDGDADLEGAYRIMNNPAVTFKKLLAGHAEGTAQRARQAGGNVLVVHDTTQCTFAHVDPEEIGYLQTGMPGFLLHLSLVLDAAHWRRPLGVIAAETIHRPKRRKLRGKKRPSGHVTADDADREFARWQRGMLAAGIALAECWRVIHLADRESDSYALMAALLAARQRFVFRVRTDRRARPADAETLDWSKVKQVAAACEGRFEREVPLERRRAKSAPQARRTHPPRDTRLARLCFAATQVEIARPQYLHDPIPPTLRLNLVHVSEPDPPPGEKAVEWLLYTTEPIDTEAQVGAVVDDYRERWTIEEFNGALKTGCAYEKRQFESRHALLTMLAITLPIAVEVLWLRSRARSQPEAPATDVVTPRQVQILRALGRRPLSANPTAAEALLSVAALGGHLRHNGPPGWRVLLRGMESLLMCELGWIAHEEAGHRPRKRDQ